MSNLSVTEMVALVRRDCVFWAPEVRAGKVLDWLEVGGMQLYKALRSLPDNEREACGVDLVKPRDGAS